MRKPRLLNNDGSERARLSPALLSASLDISPPSTAAMTLLPDSETVKIHDFVEIYRGEESLGIFRASSINPRCGEFISISLEHGIATLDDDIYPGAGSFTVTVAEAMQAILEKQTVVMWKLGAVETNDLITVEYNGSKLLQLITALMGSLTDYILVYDQSKLPWTVSIVKMPDEIACECRLNRNISSLEWTLDDSEFCTRVYQTGSDVYYESSAVSEWGVKSQQADLGIYPDAGAEEYLKAHDHPKLSVEIDAVDLSSITNESMDRFTLGVVCRTTIPDYSTVFHERIVGLRYNDLLDEENSAQLMLSTIVADTASTIIKNESFIKRSIRTFEERVYHFEGTAEEIETEMSYISQRQDDNDETIIVLEEQVSSVQQTSESLKTEISNKVSQKDFDDTVTRLEEDIFELEATSEQFSLELSSKVTQSEVDEAIENIDEFHNTAISITAQGMDVNTTGAISFTVDGELQLHIDEEAVNAKLVVAEELRAKNAVLKNTELMIPWKGSIQSSLDAAPKWLADCNATLNIPAGVYQENVVIRGFKGNMLFIMPEYGGEVTINGYVIAEYCDYVGISGDSRLNIIPRDAADPLYIYNVGYAVINGVNISGYRSRTGDSDGSLNGIDIACSHFSVRNCTIEYTNRAAISANYGATGLVYNCKGGNTGSSYYANINAGNSIRAVNGSHVGVDGTIPMAAGQGIYAGLATVVQGSVVQMPGGIDYVAPAEVTKSFAITKHCTYVYGVSRVRDDQQTRFSQGRYGTYSAGQNNWRIGAMWFGEAASELNGRTIKSATLTLRRATGGWSMAVPVYLGTVALAESAFDSTLKPAFTASATQYPGASLSRETEATYDVTELMTHVKNGHALAVYEPPAYYIPGENWSPAYTQFYGKGSGYDPVLTVTYA